MLQRTWKLAKDMETGRVVVDGYFDVRKCCGSPRGGMRNFKWPLKYLSWEVVSTVDWKGKKAATGI